MKAQVFISKLKLNSVILTELPILKIYFDISQELEFAFGSFSYINDNGITLDLPIIYMPDGIMLLNLTENKTYTGTLKLNFRTGEKIIQPLSFALMNWLNELSIEFTPYYKDRTFNGAIGLKVDPEQMNNVDHFEVTSNLINNGATLSLSTTKSKSFFMDGPLQTAQALTLSRIDKDGTAYQSQIQICIPNLVPQPPTFNAPNLGYNKTVDSHTLQETYNIPTTKNIVPHEGEWLTHNPETSSLSDTSPLAVKSAISPDVGQYINQHNLDQHNNYLDYSELRDQGFAAGPTTDVTWDKTHEGNQLLIHEGTVNQDREVQSEQTNINAPDINYQYGTKTSTFNGDTFSQSAINAVENTGNEQSIINNMTETAPQVQENYEQSIEDYIAQHYNFNSFNMTADEFSNNSFIQVWAKDHFDLSDLGDIQTGFITIRQPKRQENNDDDYNVFVATVYAEAHLSNYITYEGTNYYAQDFLNKTVPANVIAYQQANPKKNNHWAKTSDAAIKAVASVIMNRIGKKQWSKYKTPKDIIIHTGFDAYGKKNYNDAYFALKSSNYQRQPDLKRIYELLKPIYYNNAVTINANYYLSPVTQIIGNPIIGFPQWASENFLVEVSGMIITDDFAFYKE